MRGSKFLTVSVAFAVAFGAGLLVGAERPVRVFLNDEDVTPALRPRLVDGQLVGAIVPAVEAMGASATWDEEAAELRIRPPAPEPWVTVDRPTIAGQTRPYEFRALGPILTLRHYLSEAQWESLNQPPESQEPVLVRFEIVDALNLGMFPTPDSERPTQLLGGRGFALTAILYWVTLDRTAGYPRGASRFVSPLALPIGAVERSPELQTVERRLRERVQEMVRRHKESGDTRPGFFCAEDSKRGLQYNSETGFGRTGALSHWGPWPRQLSIETMEYVLKPEGVLGPRQVEGQYGPLEEVVQGASGWVVDETRTRRVSAKAVGIGEYNHIVPLYDISVAQFPAVPPPPPEDPFALPVGNTHCRW